MHLLGFHAMFKHSFGLAFCKASIKKYKTTVVNKAIIVNKAIQRSKLVNYIKMYKKKMTVIFGQK